MGIIYRNAVKEDAPVMARLVEIASGGFIHFLFHDLIPGSSPLKIVEHGLGSDEEPYTWRNAVVAESQGKVIGISLSYPSSYHRITPGMEAFIPAERLDHVRKYYDARVEDSWLIESLALFPEYHNRGVGSRLIDLTRKRARERGYPSLSLLVYTDNVAAQRLYFRHGFLVVRQVDLGSHEYIPHEEGCLLMKCPLENTGKIQVNRW
ncbi:MAG: GNAT family N-acetyltransferase [Synergistales bacterium]|nr:GNAT family N-acetyltransferase [Synergistales bacterium]